MKRIRRGGLISLLTSLGWVGGVFALLLAVGGPLWFHLIHTSSFRSDIEEAATLVATLQREELVVRERYLSFNTRGGQLPAFVNSAGTATSYLNDRRILLTGWQRENGNFLIRAMTRPDAIASNWLPAILLEKELDASGKTVRQTWIEG